VYTDDDDWAVALVVVVDVANTDLFAEPRVAMEKPAEGMTLGGVATDRGVLVFFVTWALLGACGEESAMTLRLREKAGRLLPLPFPLSSLRLALASNSGIPACCAFC